MGLIEGQDLVKGNCVPFELFNNVKNHWHSDDLTTDAASAVAGMILSQKYSQLCFKVDDDGNVVIIPVGDEVIANGSVVCTAGAVVRVLNPQSIP